MQHKRFLLPLALFCLSNSNALHAWSECGHHIVAEIAYDLLSTNEQTELLAILAEHPRYAEDFSPPKNTENETRWRVGRAGYWPDVARSQEKYNRPTWHYQLGATFTIGKSPDVDVPDDPGPLPTNATLDTQGLYVLQAIELCQQVMADTSRSESDRALALCWLAHLVADVHQPCHAGSIYVVDVFADGDRGANRIKTQAGNLHSLWDGLLGRRYDEGDIRRRRLEITGNEEFLAIAKEEAANQELSAWVAESRQWAKSHVYTSEVMGPIRAKSNGFAESLPKLDLSKDYLQKAGKLAQLRAAMAGYRLARIWQTSLQTD